MAEEGTRAPTYVRVYADSSGETHFEDVFLRTEVRSSPTGTLEARADPLPTDGVVFRTVVTEASDTNPHNAPERLLIVQLDGTVEVEVSDGERRQFGPGSALLVEDLTGKGHVTRKVSDGVRSTLVAVLAG
jgi:hypothetical protein